MVSKHMLDRQWVSDNAEHLSLKQIHSFLGNWKHEQLFWRYIVYLETKNKKKHCKLYIWIVFFSRFGGFSFGEKTKLAKLNNQNVQELLQKFSLLKTDDKSFGIDNDKIWSNVALLLHTMATEDIVKVMANSAPYA